MKTSEAADVLSVSPTTLRAWEVRHGFPVPSRTLGRHRVYDRSEVLALRRALEDGLSVASAIEKVRSNLGLEEVQLEAELRGLEDEGADRAMEIALGVQRLERAVEEVLLPALEVLYARNGGDSVGWAFAAAWARDWLARQIRLCPQPTSAGSLLLGDATQGELDPDYPPMLAFELFVRRSGWSVMRLPVAAVKGLCEATGNRSVVVVAGRAPREQVDRWLAAVHRTGGAVPLMFMRAPGRRPEIPAAPSLAAQALLAQPGEQRPRLAV